MTEQELAALRAQMVKDYTAAHGVDPLNDALRARTQQAQENIGNLPPVAAPVAAPVQLPSDAEMAARGGNAFRAARAGGSTPARSPITAFDQSAPNAAMAARGESTRITGTRDGEVVSPYIETPMTRQEPIMDAPVQQGAHAPVSMPPAAPPAPITKADAVKAYISQKKNPTPGFDIGHLIADLGANMAHRSSGTNDAFFEKRQAYEDAEPEREQKAAFINDSMDPASNVSTMGRSLVEKMMGKALPPTMSWSQIQPILGPAGKMYDEQLEREYRMATLASHAKTAAGAGGADSSVAVPGFVANPAIKVQPAQAQKLRDSKAEFDSFNKNLANMKELQKKYGNFEFGGEGAAQMSSLHSDMLINLKNMAELGAITGPDMKIIEGQLADPASFTRILSNNKSGAASLNQLEKNMANKFYNKMAASGYTPAGAQTGQPSQMSQQDAEALDWASKNPNDPRAKSIRERLGVK